MNAAREQQAEEVQFLSGRDIVCMSHGAWDEMVQVTQQLMTRLAKQNRVLFVDQPVSPFEFLSGVRSWRDTLHKLRLWLRGRRRVGDNLVVATPPPLIPRRTNGFVNRLNSVVLRRWLVRQARAVGFDRPIFWNFQPWTTDLRRALDPSVALYYCVDDFSSAPESWNPSEGVRTREEECCREADIVICTGRSLVEKHRKSNPNIHFVPEAADIELFATARLPETRVADSIARLPHPVVGVAGMINWRIDIDLISYLAARHPEWSLALVGPVKLDDADLARLRAIPNVHLLGMQTVPDLPKFLKGMDVCLIPYVLNEYTHHVFPLKLYEYLAAGKPIVSTDMFEMRAYEGELLTIGRTREEFHDGIMAALATDSPSRADVREGIARKNSWEHRLESVTELLTPMLNERATMSSGQEATG